MDRRNAVLAFVALALTHAAAAQMPAASGKATGTRRISFNGRALSPEQLQRLEALERAYGVRIPDAGYWYDNRSGAVGLWQGPALAAFPAGLELGGPLPVNASLGGTGVFVNGRELHPLDVAGLSQIMVVMRGRYWVDANGYFGAENGPAIGNLFMLANAARARQPSAQHRVYAPGELSGLVGNSAGYCTASGNCAYPR